MRIQNGIVLTSRALRATEVYSSPTKISMNSIPKSRPASMPGHNVPSRIDKPDAAVPAPQHTSTAASAERTIIRKTGLKP